MSEKSDKLAATMMATYERIMRAGAEPEIVIMPLSDAEALGAVLTDEDRARGYWTNEGKE